MATATTPKHTFEEAKNKGQEAAGNVMDKAKDVASSVADKAKDAASAVGQGAENATHAVGSGIKSLGETIRDKGPHGGFMGTASSSLAGTLESSGRYLEREGLSGMAEDVTNLIRRNPIPALLIGVGLGFCIARLTMPRS
jgi:hypothetical protein